MKHPQLMQEDEKFSDSAPKGIYNFKSAL